MANVMATLALFLALDLGARDGCVTFRDSHSRHDNQEASWPLSAKGPPIRGEQVHLSAPHTDCWILSPTSGSQSSETDAIMRVALPSTSK